MAPCEFSERQFEFCANYELQTRLGAYLIGGVPAIPTQVAEAAGGYDAAYTFGSGRALFIQYKRSQLTRIRHGHGAATWDLWGEPYFRAYLHQDGLGRHRQHNALVSLVSSCVDVLYVAPGFRSLHDLQAAFAAGTGSVLAQSLLAPVAPLPRLRDRRAHSLTYPAAGDRFRLHSEVTGPYDAPTDLGALLDAVERRRWDEDFFGTLLSLLEELPEDQRWRHEPPVADDPRPLARLGFLMERRPGAVLALFPDSESAR